MWRWIVQCSQSVRIRLSNALGTVNYCEWHEAYSRVAFSSRMLRVLLLDFLYL